MSESTSDGAPAREVEASNCEMHECGGVVAGNGEEMPPEVQARMAVVQGLLGYQGSERYGEMQAKAAKTLGVSIRSVPRFMKAWRENGILGLMPQVRSDRGEARISQEWQEFIVKTYREGNRGSRRLSPA